ncbi:DUF1993 family protein [Marinibactrum halimedae]|uniref:DUF1993 domain-containing protein n=1 Tax=Marinibactrum halimedae TaxID=1444977 RepID=A0AA37T6V1_9GAMM|nr:DUF1993 family protein [Marinibactrum halimedae]MCD9460536.1 DUF1993 domain-containing protein [Marinibactrum halimedae]GLS27899.1 hypothetical protein GCM10007877_36180 [Marinibactrum halimedae]
MPYKKKKLLRGENMNLKKNLLKYLDQLKGILKKTPEGLFSKSLDEKMLPLGVHGKVAANFALRGYCPVVNRSIPHESVPGFSKTDVLYHINDAAQHLTELPDIECLNQHKFHSENAGNREIKLPEPEFIHLYILPNFYFHISMVYAIARANGVELGKGDFDGLHEYPSGFSFIAPAEKQTV